MVDLLIILIKILTLSTGWYINSDCNYYTLEIRKAGMASLDICIISSYPSTNILRHLAMLSHSYLPYHTHSRAHTLSFNTQVKQIFIYLSTTTLHTIHSLRLPIKMPFG